MYFRCVFTLLLCCVLVGLDWAKPMMYLYLHVTFSCIRTFKFLYLLYCILFGAFLIVSLSLSLPLSLFLTLVATWHLNVSLLRPGTLFVPGHLLFLLYLTPLILMFGFVIRRPNRTSWRTFHDATFIRNTKSFY